MRLIYLNNAFHSEHGGRVHAREFYAAATRNPRIEHIEVLPAASASPVRGGGGTRTRVPTWIRDRLRPLQLLRLNTWGLRDVRARVARHPADAILVRTWTNFLILPALRRAHPGLVIAAEVNSSPFDEYLSGARPHALFRRLESWALSHCDLVVFVSEELRSRVNGWGPVDATQRVVHNGVDLSRFRRKAGRAAAKFALAIPESAPVIGYVGGMEPYRKLPLLVTSFVELLALHPDAHLVIVGDGADRPRVETTIRSAGIQSERIHLVGRVDHDAVPELIEAFDVAVHHAAKPYMSPLKLFEYMAMGVPVVAPDLPAVREIVTDGEHAVLATPDQVSIGRAIHRVLSDQDGAGLMANRARDLVSSLTWDRVAEMVLAEVDRAIDSRRSVSSERIRT